MKIKLLRGLTILLLCLMLLLLVLGVQNETCLDAPVPLSVSVSPTTGSTTLGSPERTYMATVSGGVPPYTVVWRDDNGSQMGTGKRYQFPAVTQPGKYRIYAEVKDSVNSTAQSNTVTITMSSATTYVLTLLPSIGGTVYSLKTTYNVEERATIKATPAMGYRFDYWLVDSTRLLAAYDTTNPLNLVMGSNHLVEAVFAPSTTKTVNVSSVMINVVAGIGGTITPSGSHTFTIGTAYSLDSTFAPTPNSGQKFDHWTLNGVTIASTLMITKDLNGATLTAVFIALGTGVNKLYVDGTKIRVADPLSPGMEIFLIGANVRSQVHNPYNDGEWDDWWTYRDADATTLASWGFNFIRLVCYWDAIEKSQTPSQFVYDMAYVQKIRETVAAYNSKGIYVLVDLHTHTATYASNLSKFMPIAGNAFAGTWYSDTSATSAREHLKRIWQMLSNEFKGVYGIAGYDLCNEPHLGDPTITLQQANDYWFDIADYVITAIRANGDDHIAFINFSPWASDTHLWNRKLLDSQVVYEPHWYAGIEMSASPWTVTNSDLVWVQAQWTSRFKDKIEAFDVPFMVGELGFETLGWQADRELWLRNSLTAFWGTDGFNGYTYWSFIEYHGNPVQSWYAPILVEYAHRLNSP